MVSPGEGGGEPVRTVMVLAGPADLADSLEVADALAAQAVLALQKAELFAQVQELAVQDHLTGLANRRHFTEVAGVGLTAARHQERPVLVLMVDIDHFKSINDTYGHLTGDDVIRGVAERLSLHTRETDVVARYGGEEFVLLLPDAEPMSPIPERLRAAVADVPIPTRSGPLPVTVSIGVADALVGDLESLLSRADEALYRAKQDGRNRVTNGTANG